MSPDRLYSQPDPARFQPNTCCTHKVSTPLRPTVAKNANASATPPNWASTLHSEITARRTIEVGGLLTISHASTAPSTAPIIAVLPESSTLFHSADSAVPENSAWIRANENAPSA